MSGTDPGDDPSLPLSQFERVVATCDRFEAAWRAGQRPRVEDYLGDLPDPDRPALLHELLALELVYRRLSGEVLEEEEFRRRFPGHDAVVDSVLPGEQPAPPGPIERPKADRPRAEADRGLLFGVLALQNDFISRDDLVAAFAVWVADKARPLGQILVDRGALDDARRALLEALVGEHLKRHGGDPEKSLAALSSLGAAAGTSNKSPTPSCTPAWLASPPTAAPGMIPMPQSHTLRSRPRPRAGGSASSGSTIAAAWAKSSSPMTRS